MCNEGECLECMQIDRSQLLEYLDKIARYLINEGIVKTDDMTNEEVFGYVVETVSALRAEVAAKTQALKVAEWGRMNPNGHWACPICKEEENHGHAKNCELAAALNAPSEGQKRE